MVRNLMGDMGVQNRPQRPQGLLGKGGGGGVDYIPIATLSPPE